MEKTRNLYLMISHTGTGVGRIIRCFTRYPYNHVSLSLDPTFSRWVSFARYVQNVPLAGGFIEEGPARFYADSEQIKVRVFRIPISEERFRTLEQLFAKAGDRSCGLLYNTFDAMVVMFGFAFPVRGAYTCLEFANAILGTNFRKIRTLNDTFAPNLIFEGELSELVAVSEQAGDDFFNLRSFPRALKETAHHFRVLLRYTLSPPSPDPLTALLPHH